MSTPVSPTSSFRLGDRQLNRLGYGAMQLTGEGVWGEPHDRQRAKEVLRRSMELGVNFIDTADSYGPAVSERIIHDALHPYSPGTVVATKAGLARTGPGKWVPIGRPAYLRQQAEMSLRWLETDRLELFQLHRVDPEVGLADQVGTLRELQQEGKVAHIGLSEVDVPTLKAAREIANIDTVQNQFNLTNRASEDVLDYCEAEGIGFIPWFPVATGDLAGPGSMLEEVAADFEATPAQLALSWLLHRSPVMLPIPGTSSPEHLEENMAAAEIHLSDEQFSRLSSLAQPNR